MKTRPSLVAAVSFSAWPGRPALGRDRIVQAGTDTGIFLKTDWAVGPSRRQVHRARGQVDDVRVRTVGVIRRRLRNT